MTQISEYSFLLRYETKTRRLKPFRALPFPPNKEPMNTRLQVNLKNSVKGIFFLPHKVLQHFIYSHIHNRVKPKSFAVLDMGMSIYACPVRVTALQHPGESG